MAPEPNSPSASFVLLPLVGGRSRRGSLASLQSRREIDKEVLAQALDQIHTSACKSEALTSFDDFDGGAGGSRSGAKALVTGGVSGLYNRIRQSVGGTPAKELRGRPQSRGSKETADVGSTFGASPSTLQSSIGPPKRKLNVETASNASSAVSSPVTTSFSPRDDRLKRVRTNGERSSSAATPPSGPANDNLERVPTRTLEDFSANYVSGSRKPRSVSDAASEDIDTSPGAEESPQADLKRVLSRRDIEEARAVQASSATANDHTRNDMRSITSTLDVEETLNKGGPPDEQRRGTNDRPQSPRDAVQPKDPDQSERPPMLHISQSHLPGFKPSRTNSTVEGDSASMSSAHTFGKQPSLDQSQNINGALQRRRTMPRNHGGSTKRAPQPISSHLKRRVVSKEFWMKDENAKDCFYCGDTFSTFRRKHHCRTCGQIFDAKCTSLLPGRPFGQPGTLRLCKPCEGIIYGSDDDSTVFSDDENDDFRSPVATQADERYDDVPENLDGSSSMRPEHITIATPSIGIPASRRNREAKRRSAVIEFDAQPMLARPSSSRSLKSLTGRPRSSSHRRHHSRHQHMRNFKMGPDDRAPFHQDTMGDPEKRAHLPAFHNDNVIDPDLAPFLSDEGSSDEERPSIFTAMNADGQAASPGERERLGLGGFLSSALKKGRSRLGERSTGAHSVAATKDDDALSIATRHLPKLSRKRNPSISSLNFSRPSPRRSRSTNLLKTIESDFSTEQRPVSPHVSQAVVAPTGVGSKVIRSSAMHGAGAPRVELNNASLHHVKQLLAQTLKDANIGAAKFWEDALVPILLQCTDDVEPDVQRGDDMDVRHYVKLKKVPGGRPNDTSYVSGVVFSKNVALKSMARNLTRPRIAIVTFAIEYARHQSHFMSLEPVIAQEREYLRNLVGRIAALRPQVLLVQRNVSGLALQLLDDAGITVVYNIKESVLAAVARVTETTLIKSVDKLAIDPSHLGQCENFEVKTFVHQGSRKTYVYLSGCQPDLGCTIVLRGTDTKTLRKVKRITEFMCYVVYNLKLETSLMRDEFVAVPSVAAPPAEQIDGPSAPLEHADHISHHVATADFVSQANTKVNGHHPHGSTEDRDFSKPDTVSISEAVPRSKYSEMEEASRTRILSASPFVRFMPPYLLTQTYQAEQNVAYFKKLRDQYALTESDNSEDEKQEIDEKFELVRPEMVHVAMSKHRSKTVRDFLHAVHSAQYEKAVHTFDTQKRLWDSFVAGNSSPFDPFSHQNIVVLHSTVSTTTSAPCTGPELLGLGFYAGYNHVEPSFEEDFTLGQYIEELCLGANTTCKECNRRLLDHHRQYVHGYGQLSVSIQRSPPKIQGLQNLILMWSTCRVCNEETSVTPMSDNTWKYSFAKYLELSFWSTPLHPRAGICSHDIHKDFVRCFGFQDMVVKVVYETIDIYDVVVPRATITWKVDTDLTLKNQQYSGFLSRLTAFTASVRTRLESINTSTVVPEKSEDAAKAVKSLLKRAEDEHNELLRKLQQKYVSSRYYELVPLNRALRFMDEKAIAWDVAFTDFERNFFPSEHDIRRLATIQLKKFFLDRNEAVEAIPSDFSDTEEGTEMKPFPEPSLDVHLTAEELQSEKAQNMLHAVVEEHGTSPDKTANTEIPPPSLKKETSTDSTDSVLVRKTTPTDAQVQAVEREDVKHLDLAVTASKSPETISNIDQALSSDDSKTSSRPDTRDSQGTPEAFATEPKPLNSTILERIEQMRTAASGNAPTEPTPESRIPRLADLKKREGASLIPPLMRAQSQPSHVPRRSADMNVEQPSIDAVAMNGTTHTANDAAEDEAQMSGPRKTIDQRLSERLGGTLNTRVGKVPASLIPRSIPSKSEHYSNPRVSALAKHFEQLSREFERERLKERRMRASQSRQARANPLASSRPVVEVYRNATDAVGGKAVEEKEVPDNTGDILQETGAERTASPVVEEPLPGEQTIPEQAVDMDHDSQHVDADDNHAASDTDIEGLASDAEDLVLPPRRRDISDPTSGMSSSTLLSPTSPHDMEMDLSLPEAKKTSVLKMLTSFWSERSASGWLPLEYPLHPNEHVFDDSDIIVREDEPSSVIALALSSSDYLNKVREFRSHPNKHKRKHAHTGSQASTETIAEAEQQKAIEASLISDTGTHMKYSFAHGPVRAQCKIFYAESFDALRRKCGVSERFVESLSRCLKWDSKGGKTKSLFLKTLDDRFVVKSLQEVELKAFTKFAPDYFAFMSYTLFHGVPSVIAKMLGLFQVVIKNPATGVDFSYYLLVMENLFYARQPDRRFDLKGSMRNRKIESTGQADEVLLDENLVETIFEKPLFVREHARKLLHASVWNDTMWLCKQNVMDYSLMAGFDDERKELIVGIIDCIRTYTWDKKLESWIKDRGKNKPTITSPKDYRNRFRVSMMQYVLQAPNCWHQFQAQMVAPTTLKEKEETEDTEADKYEIRRSEG